MKRKIPLIVLEIIQPILDQNSDIVKGIEDEKALIHIVDLDKQSDFYYKLLSTEQSGAYTNYAIDFKPQSRENANATTRYIRSDDFKVHVSEWIKYIRAYNAIITIYDDPILKQYEEEFFNDFVILEENAAFSAFNFKEQLALDKYLDDVKVIVTRLKEGRNEDEQILLSEIELEASDIQAKLTSGTKKEIIKNITKLWAKARKIGLGVFKEIFIKVASDVAVKFISGGV